MTSGVTAGVTAGTIVGATAGTMVGASTAMSPATLDDDDGVVVEMTTVDEVDPTGPDAVEPTGPDTVVVDGTRLLDGEAPELVLATVAL